MKNTMKYELAIFDLDGTILNTIEDLADSVNYALAAENLPLRKVSEVRAFLGNGIANLISLSVPKGTAEEVTASVLQTFREYYSIHCAEKTAPYDGISELFDQLRKNGCKVAILSNKIDSAVKELCHHYFEGLYDLACGERSGVKRKPAPDGVYEILDRLAVAPDRAVYIGDSEVDFQTAQNCKIDGILVSWGFRDRSQLEKLAANPENGSINIVSTVKELSSLFYDIHRAPLVF